MNTPEKVEVALGQAGMFQVVNVPVFPADGAYFPVASRATTATDCLVRFPTWMTVAGLSSRVTLPLLLLR